LDFRLPRRFAPRNAAQFWIVIIFGEWF
jgi:hypothetical protein